jgi:hypothetical protein
MGGSDGLTWSSPIQTVLRDREAGAWPEMEIDPVTATRRRTVQGRDRRMHPERKRPFFRVHC